MIVELLSIVITEKNVECPPKKTVKLSQKNQRNVQKKMRINVGSVSSVQTFRWQFCHLLAAESPEWDRA